MQTAKEFLKEQTEGFEESWRTKDDIIEALLQRFAKLHFEEIVKQANDYKLTTIK